MEIRQSGPLKGELTVPGDKSISHRSVMFGAIAKGLTEVTNFLQGADCLSTISCFRQLGISIENTPEKILVHGRGLHGLSAPEKILDAGNSVTTSRLLSGILSGQEFSSVLTGDASIQKRPMKRIMEPLSLMGAQIESVRHNGCAPLSITGRPLHGISYATPVASAQVKSAILLAGLYADSPTQVTEPLPSRNHTELMLKGFGANLVSEGKTALLRPGFPLFGQKIEVPGDISSAAYFLAAGLLVPGSEILVKNVGINPTRSGILSVIRSMGGRLEILNERLCAGEPVADLFVSFSPLHGTVIEGELIPALIDELPMIAVMAAFAQGTTVIRDAAELKVKESDRIATTTAGLKAMGADVTPTPDGMIICGGRTLHGASVSSFEDHRIAMSFAVAAMAAEGTTVIENGDCVRISYPGFYNDLALLASDR